MKILKVKFEATQNMDGVDSKVDLAIQLPTAKIKQAARLVHARAYKEALENGAMMREELEGFLRKSKMWDDDRQAEFDLLRNAILDGERKLRTGGVKLKDARELAIKMSKDRNTLQELLSQSNRMDRETADAHADQEQFNYLVAHCTVYNDTGKPYFTTDGEHASVDSYVERGGEQVALVAASKLSEVLYGNEKDILEKLPENVFLKKWKFIDENFHLIDDKGRKVDEKGRLVNEDGRFIDEHDQYVDADGNRVDEEGNYLVEFSPFLDDNGNPIVETVSVPSLVVIEDEQ